jgi:transposase
MDEHRIGLKPIVRGVWAPVGERPIALGHHRFEWLYVTGFVEPASGRTVWNIANTVCKEMFELVLADFAKSVGAGPTKRIVLQLDNAGWHGPENLAVPDGIYLVFQPAHSPELQPAEHLWAFVDEPLANHCFATIESLDQAVGDRCIALTRQPDIIRDSTLFHWWPCHRARTQSTGVGITRHNKKLRQPRPSARLESAGTVRNHRNRIRNNRLPLALVAHCKPRNYRKTGRRPLALSRPLCDRSAGK